MRAAGYGFSLRVLKEDFSRGVELLADNELHPALPAEAFTVVQQQTAQFVAGNMQSPGYKTSRALDHGAAAEGRSGAARGDAGERWRRWRWTM